MEKKKQQLVSGGTNDTFSGPCAIENRDNIIRIAEELSDLANNSKIDFYFKSNCHIYLSMPWDCCLIVISFLDFSIAFFKKSDKSSLLFNDNK